MVGDLQFNFPNNDFISIVTNIPFCHKYNGVPIFNKCSIALENNPLGRKENLNILSK